MCCGSKLHVGSSSAAIGYFWTKWPPKWTSDRTFKLTVGDPGIEEGGFQVCGQSPQWLLQAAATPARACPPPPPRKVLQNGCSEVCFPGYLRAWFSLFLLFLLVVKTEEMSVCFLFLWDSFFIACMQLFNNYPCTATTCAGCAHHWIHAWVVLLIGNITLPRTIVENVTSHVHLGHKS